MILKSFQILAICTSMAVTPSNFNYETKKQLQNYTVEIKLNAPIQTEVNNGTYTQFSQKYYGTTQSDQFMISQSSYSNAYYDINDTYPYETIINTTYQKQQNSFLTIYQIAPYRTTQNNTLSLSMNIRLNIAYGETPTTYTMYTDVYNSTETYWNKYIDASNYGAWYGNYDKIADITDGTKGFMFTKETYQQSVTENSDVSTPITQQVNLYINPSKTNYIYMYTYCLYEDETQATGHVTKVIAKNMFSTVTGNNVSTTITGQMADVITGYEVVDIPGIMWEVLSMPFTFISIAFNLTLFPNTPYQVNLSNLFLSILGAIIFIFIMSKFVFKK